MKKKEKAMKQKERKTERKKRDRKKNLLIEVFKKKNVYNEEIAE